MFGWRLAQDQLAIVVKGLGGLGMRSGMAPWRDGAMELFMRQSRAVWSQCRVKAMDSTTTSHAV